MPSLRFASALTDEEKKNLFMKSREEMKTVPSDVEETPKPKPKPKPATRKTKPGPTPKPTPEQTPEPTPKKKPAPEPTPEHTPKHTPTPQPEETPVPKPTPTPTPSSTPTPSQPAAPAAPVVIEKSGVEQETGYAPPPPSGFFGWFRGPTYRYLTKSVRAEIDRAPVKKRRWRYIVVHNSGTRQGNAKIFDYYHRYTRKMPNGLAYHFVIGNGTSSGNGQIEIGSRWSRQINGGHVHSDYLNNIAVGICLVGDYNRSQPTRQQLEALEELIRYLRLRVGKIDRKWAIVKPHREINPPQWPTDCPGDKFPFRWLHGKFD